MQPAGGPEEPAPPGEVHGGEDEAAPPPASPEAVAGVDPLHDDPLNATGGSGRFPISPHANTIPSLIVQLTSRHEEVLAQATGVLYDLAMSAPEQALIIEGGGISALRSVLLASTGVVRERAACVLHRMPTHE